MGICASLPDNKASKKNEQVNNDKRRKRIHQTDSSDDHSDPGIVHIAHIIERPNDSCPCHSSFDEHEADQHECDQHQSIMQHHETHTHANWTLSPMIVVDHEAHRHAALDIPELKSRKPSMDSIVSRSDISCSVSMSPTYESNIESSPTLNTSLLANSVLEMPISAPVSFVSQSVATSPSLKPTTLASRHNRSRSCVPTPLSPIVSKHACYRSSSPFNQSPNVQSHARTRSFSILEVMSLPALSPVGTQSIAESPVSPPSPPPISEAEIETEMYDSRLVTVT